MRSVIALLAHAERRVHRRHDPVELAPARRRRSRATRRAGCSPPSRPARGSPSSRSFSSRTSLDLAQRARPACTSLPKPNEARVVGHREVRVAALPAPPRPSARACCARPRASCGSAGRPAGRSSVDELAAACARSRASQLAAALAQLRLDVVEAEQLVHLLLGRAACASRRSSSSSMPYSLTCRPRRTAYSRSATLCCLEPVRCWSTLPNWSGATTRKSTAQPVVGDDPRARLAARPHLADQLQLGERLRRAPPGRARSRSMSRSLQVSVMRRALPGDLDAVRGRMRAQRARRSARRSPSTADSSSRSRWPVARSSAVERREDVLLGLRAEPGDRCAAAPPSAASRSSSSVAMPSSSWILRAVFGPRPGMLREARPARRGTSRAASPPAGSRRSRAAPRSSPRASCRRCGSSVARPSRGELRDRRGRLPHRLAPPGGRRPPGRRPRRRARRGRPARPGRRRSRRSSSRDVDVRRYCRDAEPTWPPGPSG